MKTCYSHARGCWFEMTLNEWHQIAQDIVNGRSPHVLKMECDMYGIHRYYDDLDVDIIADILDLAQ